MVYMGQGDIDPKTAALQVLLNRVAGSDNAPIAVDGIFGPETARAVTEFQQRRSLEETGRINPATWLELTQTQELTVIDVMDGRADDAPRVTVGIRSAGGRPILLSGQIVESEMRSIGTAVDGAICLLRFRVCQTQAPATSLLNVLGTTPVQSIAGMRHVLAHLRGLFAPFGSVEIHGRALGQDVAGRQLLRELADIWGVPVTAGMSTKPEGAGVFWTHRFEGWAYTACPQGQNLDQWAAKLSAGASAHGAARG